MKNAFTDITSITSQLIDLLDHDIITLRNKMVAMFKSVSSDKANRRRERKCMVFMLEILQDLEKDRDAPFGREEYQRLIDEGLKAIDQDIRQIAGFKDFEIEEVVTNSASYSAPKAERSYRDKSNLLIETPNTQGGVNPIMETSSPSIFKG